MWYHQYNNTYGSNPLIQKAIAAAALPSKRFVRLDCFGQKNRGIVCYRTRLILRRRFPPVFFFLWKTNWLIMAELFIRMHAVCTTRSSSWWEPRSRRLSRNDNFWWGISRNKVGRMNLRRHIQYGNSFMLTAALLTYDQTAYTMMEWRAKLYSSFIDAWSSTYKSPPLPVKEQI